MKILKTLKIKSIDAFIKMGKCVHDHPNKFNLGLRLLLTLPFWLLYLWYPVEELKKLPVVAYWVIAVLSVIYLAFGNDWVSKRLSNKLISLTSVDSEREKALEQIKIESMAEGEKSSLELVVPHTQKMAAKGRNKI